MIIIGVAIAVERNMEKRKQPLSANKLDKFRRRLEELRNQRVKYEKALEEEELKELSAEQVGEVTRIPSHHGDVGSEASVQSTDAAISQLEIREIQEIEDAMARLDQGKFGICENCGAMIQTTRLEAQPEARYCKSCEEGLGQNKGAEIPGSDSPSAQMGMPSD